MPYYRGSIQECSWAYFTGELRASDWAAFVKDSREIYREARPGTLLLTIPYAYGTPNADQRRALGDTIRDSPGARNVTHHAFVTDSTLLMAINSAITWLGNKPWLEKTFTDPQLALEWLTRAARSLSPALIASEIGRVVPPSELWPKLKRTSSSHTTTPRP